MKKTGLIALAVVVLLAGCGQAKTTAKKAAPSAPKQTLKATTYTQDGSTIALSKDGTFVAETKDNDQHTDTMRQGTYEFNHAKTKATLKVTGVTTATYPDQSALDQATAPQQITRKLKGQTLTLTEKTLPTLTLADAKKSATKLSNYDDFYPALTKKYNATYGALEPKIYVATTNTPDDIGGGFLWFKGNHFFWRLEPTHRFGVENAVVYAEGSYVFDVANSALKLTLTDQSPLYHRPTGIDYDDRPKLYVSSEAGPINDHVTLKLSQVGGNYQMRCDDPDVGTYVPDSDNTGMYTVAHLESQFHKALTITDVFPTADDFLNDYQSTISSDDADNLDNFNVESDQTISVMDSDGASTQIPVKYVISYVNTAASHAEHYAVSESGSVYWSVAEGDYSEDADATAKMQQRISDAGN
jgi:hypothetical protein